MQIICANRKITFAKTEEAKLRPGLSVAKELEAAGQDLK
jgi:hypothetical protein